MSLSRAGTVGQGAEAKLGSSFCLNILLLHYRSAQSQASLDLGFKVRDRSGWGLGISLQERKPPKPRIARRHNLPNTKAQLKHLTPPKPKAPNSAQTGLGFRAQISKP